MSLNRKFAWIFDNDGLAQDTEPHYEESFRAIALEYGCLAPSKALLMQVKGLDLREVARLMIEQLKLPLSGYEEFKAQLDGHLLKLAPTSTMMRGFVKLVRLLKRHGKKIAVATSSTREVLNLKTKHHRLIYDLFDTVVSGDDPEVTRGKPAPDLLLVTAKRLCIDPEDCVYVGDNPVDVISAVSAKMFPIAIPGVGRSWDEFRQEGAKIIAPSLEEIVEILTT